MVLSLQLFVSDLLRRSSLSILFRSQSQTNDISEGNACCWSSFVCRKSAQRLEPNRKQMAWGTRLCQMAFRTFSVDSPGHFGDCLCGIHFSPCHFLCLSLSKTFGKAFTGVPIAQPVSCVLYHTVQTRSSALGSSLDSATRLPLQFLHGIHQRFRGDSKKTPRDAWPRINFHSLLVGFHVHFAAPSQKGKSFLVCSSGDSIPFSADINLCHGTEPLASHSHSVLGGTKCSFRFWQFKQSRHD